MSKKPLEGIRVLDFTNALAGPYCSMMLGNMGAEVIKVEKPGTGDDSRGYGPFVNGQSGYFVSVNHGKKSVVCNTKDPEGVEMLVDQWGQAVFLGRLDECLPGAKVRLPEGQPAVERRHHAGRRRVPGAQAENGADHGRGRVASSWSRSSPRPWKEL